MSGERYSFVSASGAVFPLPGSARPADDYGVAYDYEPQVGAMGDAFFVEGTGSPLPRTFRLLIPVKNRTEAQTVAQIGAIVAAAQTAATLRRTGSPDMPILKLKAWAQRATNPQNSGDQELTLDLIPGAPAQPGTGGTTTPTQPTTPAQTAIVTAMPSGLVAFYDMVPNPAAAAEVTDISGNNRHGTLGAGAPSHDGNAYVYSAAANNIIGLPNLNAGGGSFTLLALLQPTLGGLRMFATTTLAGTYVGTNTNGNVYAAVASVAQTAAGPGANLPIVGGARYDSAAARMNAISNLTQPAPVATGVNDAHTWTGIGGYGEPYAWEGRVFAWALFNRHLSDAEYQAAYLHLRGIGISRGLTLPKPATVTAPTQTRARRLVYVENVPTISEVWVEG